MAWDTADAILTTPASDGTNPSNAPGRDAFHYRNKAIKQIDAEILLLLQGCTVFSLSTTFHDPMLRYVYLRRALQGRASIDEVGFSVMTLIVSLWFYDGLKYPHVLQFALSSTKLVL